MKNRYHRHQPKGLHYKTFSKVHQRVKCPFSGEWANSRVVIYNREERVSRSTEVYRGTILSGEWDYISN